jgi:NitT/TauT family transport system permease protein
MEMARSFGGGRSLTLRRVIIPAAMPLILAGIRITVGRSIKAVIIAEQLVGLIGLGGRIQRLGGAFAVTELYAVILFIGLVGVTALAFIGRWERSMAYR